MSLFIFINQRTLRSCCVSVAVKPLTSCRNRCYEPFDNEKPGCRCDENCVTANSCCLDYYDICTAPSETLFVTYTSFTAHQLSVILYLTPWPFPSAELWECTNVRCGEKRLTQSRCHCSDDCLSAGDCCTNYKHVCHGEAAGTSQRCRHKRNQFQETCLAMRNTYFE